MTEEERSQAKLMANLQGYPGAQMYDRDDILKENGLDDWQKEPSTDQEEEEPEVEQESMASHVFQTFQSGWTNLMNWFSSFFSSKKHDPTQEP